MKTLAAFLLVVFGVPSFAQDQNDSTKLNWDLEKALGGCAYKYPLLMTNTLAYSSGAERLLQSVNLELKGNPKAKEDVILCMKIKYWYRYSSNHTLQYYSDLKLVISVLETPTQPSSQPAATVGSQEAEAGR